MNLFERIKEDQLQARKDKAPISTKSLTTLIGEVTRNGAQSDTSDNAVTAVIKKFIKGIDETLSHTSEEDQYNRSILNLEKVILQEYLPKQLSKDEIKNLIMDDYGYPFMHAITKGDLMQYLKKTYSGQYDGKVAAEAVDELLKGE